jgi:hypothetical protein
MQNRFVGSNVPEITASAPIIGTPIGRAGLQVELRAGMIPYNPSGLIRVGEAEFTWYLHEMLQQSALLTLAPIGKPRSLTSRAPTIPQALNPTSSTPS